jgi:3-hydroxyisobutyrate dehydrogenase-like beta-hydroxyacid dehydrogenase
VTTRQGKTIGLLYAGEMGAAVAAALRARGHRVVSTLEGRSRQTAARARVAEIEILNTLADVVRQSAIVLSVVPPDAATRVAASYADLARVAPPGAIYLDANSISPESAQIIAATLADHPIDFVDAAINGLAKNLATAGTIFLSGPGGPEVAKLFDPITRVCVLGEEVGRAKTMKMLLSGVSKGVCALFLELSELAQRRGILPEFQDALSRIYPGIASLVGRMLPTYTEHAPRRAAEMTELYDTAIAAGLEPRLISAIRQVHIDLLQETSV